MIAVSTTDAWTSAQITVDDGGGAQNWSPSAGEDNAYLALESFRSWMDSTFTVTSSWTWGRDATAGTLSVMFTFGASVDFTANSTAQSIFGVSASESGVTEAEMDNIAGTLAPDNPGVYVYADNYHQSVADAAAGAGVGAVRNAAPGAQPYRPRIAWPGNTVDCERLRLVLASASNPRAANLYAVDTGWISVAFGRVTRSGRRGRYRFAAEVLA